MCDTEGEEVAAMTQVANTHEAHKAARSEIQPETCGAADAPASTSQATRPAGCLGKASRGAEGNIAEGISDQKKPGGCLDAPQRRRAPLSWQSLASAVHTGELQACKTNPEGSAAANFASHLEQRKGHVTPAHKGSKRKSPELTASPARLTAEGILPLPVRQRVVAAHGKEVQAKGRHLNYKAESEVARKNARRASPSSSQRAKGFRPDQAKPKAESPDTPISKHREGGKAVLPACSDASGKRQHESPRLVWAKPLFHT